MYVVLSPDNIPINQNNYPTYEIAMRAKEKWVKGFMFQGYYSTANWERIPLDQLASRCSVILDDDDDDENFWDEELLG